jgi:regulator of sigma D
MVEETGVPRENNRDLSQVTDKLDHRYDITEILLKVALNAINQTSPERD